MKEFPSSVSGALSGVSRYLFKSPQEGHTTDNGAEVGWATLSLPLFFCAKRCLNPTERMSLAICLISSKLIKILTCKMNCFYSNKSQLGFPSLHGFRTSLLAEGDVARWVPVVAAQRVLLRDSAHWMLGYLV